jgi:prepilin-type processing-associated H-X9-DG protein
MKAGVVCIVAILIGAVAFAALSYEMVRILVFGWIAFLGRTIPRATINLSGVVSGAVTLLLLVALVHYFGRWLARGSSAEPGGLRRPWRLRWSVSIVGSVILMFVVGYASVGLARHLGWIFSSGTMYAPRVWSTEWPHVGAKAWDAINLQRLGDGFLNYCHVRATHTDRSIVRIDEPRYSWATLLLPYLSYYQFPQTDLLWNHPDSTAIFRTPIPEFYNPTLVGADQFDKDGFALIHYAGNSNVLERESKPERLHIDKDGSNTILLGEVNGNFQPWGKPGNLRDPAAGINTPGGFGGAEGSGGAQFLMLDGSVRFVSKDVDPEVLKALAK